MTAASRSTRLSSSEGSERRRYGRALTGIDLIPDERPSRPTKDRDPTLFPHQRKGDSLRRWRQAGPHRCQPSVSSHSGLPRGLLHIAFALEGQMDRLCKGEAILAGGEPDPRILTGPGQEEPATGRGAGHGRPRVLVEQRRSNDFYLFGQPDSSAATGLSGTAPCAKRGDRRLISHYGPVKDLVEVRWANDWYVMVGAETGTT